VADFVMVPVPEEIVPRVQQYLRWNLTRPVQEGHFEHDEAARFLESLDDQARRFLLAVADASVEATKLSVADAAAATECSELEALGLMMTLNVDVQRFGTVPLGLVHRQPVEGADGSRGGPVYELNMRAEIARLVLAADRGRARAT